MNGDGSTSFFCLATDSEMVASSEPAYLRWNRAYSIMSLASGATMGSAGLAFFGSAVTGLTATGFLATEASFGLASGLIEPFFLSVFGSSSFTSSSVRFLVSASLSLRASG